MTRIADFTTGSYTGITPANVNSTGGYAETTGGVLTSFAANTLRRTNKGLLVEPTATNLFNYSQDLSNGYWSKDFGGITGNTDDAPDATATADTLTEVAGYGQIGNSATAISSATTAYTISGFFKRITSGKQPYIQVNYNNGGLVASVQPFDLGTPAAASPYDLIAGVTFAAAAVAALGSSWFRCTATITVSASGTLNIYSGFGDSTSSRSLSSGASGYLWGLQIEAGNKATSYFPATSGSATRAADAVSFTVPSGVSTLTYTFDDNSTQNVSVTGGASHTIPTNLNRPYIKYIDDDAGSASTGTASGAATVSGAGRANAAGSGSSAGVATATAVGRATATATGTAAGVATVTGVAGGSQSAIGTASGSATVSGAGGALVRASGSVAGFATVSGVGSVAGTVAVGTVSGIATVSAVGSASARAAGFATGSATVLAISATEARWTFERSPDPGAFSASRDADPDAWVFSRAA